MLNSYIIQLINEHYGTVAAVSFIFICVFIERSEKNNLHPVSSFFGWIGSMMTQEIMEDLRRVETENDMRRIKDLRAEILSLSRSLKRFIAEDMDDAFTAEDFDHAEEIWMEYHELLKKYEMKNGKTIRAMTIISDCSKKHGFGAIGLNL